MKRKPVFVSLVLVFNLAIQVVIALDTGRFGVQRALSGVLDQWHRIDLPASVFAKAKPDLSDLRVIGIRASQDTVECPYILNSLVDRTSTRPIPSTMINKGMSEAEYRCTFVTTDTLSVNHIRLELRSISKFTADVRVEGSADNRAWTTITKTLAWDDSESSHTTDQHIDLVFQPCRYRYYRVRLHSYDSIDVVGGALTMETTTAGVYDEAVVVQQGKYEESKTHQTIVDVTLQSPLSVSLVQLQTSFHGDFERPMRIRALTDSVQSNGQWRYEYRTVWSGTISSFRERIFHVEPRFTQKLRIEITNGDNIPIAVEHVSARFTHTELIVRCESAQSYYLLYGDAKANAPNYDVASFRNNIPLDGAKLQLGAEELRAVSEHHQSPLFENKLWLWAVMILVIVALAGATLRMMRK